LYHNGHYLRAANACVIGFPSAAALFLPPPVLGGRRCSPCASALFKQSIGVMLQRIRVLEISSRLRSSRLVPAARNRTLRRFPLAACSSLTATLRHTADPFFPFSPITPP